MPAANQTALSYDEGKGGGGREKGEEVLTRAKDNKKRKRKCVRVRAEKLFAPTQSATTVAKRVAGAKRRAARGRGEGKGCSGSKNAHGKSKWRRQRRPQFVFSVRWRFDKVQPRNINKVDTRVCMPRVGAPHTPTTPPSLS